MTSSARADLLSQADLAERKGDRATAVAKLHEYLEMAIGLGTADVDVDVDVRIEVAGREGGAVLAVAPGRRDEGAIRLRLARLLMDLAEPVSARAVLLPLDQGGAGDWSHHANRLMALLDEDDGAVTSAQVRWERVLADDIDDAEAHSHLRALRPPAEQEGWPATPSLGRLSMGTLVVPDGVRLSRFRMIRELGRGSTAAVYLVRDERLDLPLALKVLHPQLAAAARTEARARFFGEARLAARLRHPGVVAIYGIDEEARCLAMEYIAGGTIRDRLRESARASELAAATGAPPHSSVALRGVVGDAEAALAVARSLLGALAYVHGSGIVHGDLKPGNVLLRTPRDVVLADFGMAALGMAALGVDDMSATVPRVSAATPGPTEVGERAAGTPLYLAPEQFRGAPTSASTDLFAAGAILWELLNGHPARRQADLLAGRYGVPAWSTDGGGQAGQAGRTPPLTRLIRALLSEDPNLRPVSAAAALAGLPPP